jgi:hypothetical protein
MQVLASWTTQCADSGVIGTWLMKFSNLNCSNLCDPSMCAEKSALEFEEHTLLFVVFTDTNTCRFLESHILVLCPSG